MNISVVIPTLNEQEHLGSCLDAILSGTRVPEEIIVADGGSSDCTVQIALEYGAKVVNNWQVNAAAGRNAGWRAAQGEVIAFTDGDCIPELGWLAGIESAMIAHDADGVGGRILPAEPANDIEAFWNHLQLEVVMEFGSEPFEILERNFRHSFITANCAYRKAFLERLGGFDVWFANNGEDIDLFWRAILAKGNLYYTPEATVRFHGVTDLRGVRKKSMRNGISSSKLQKVYGGRINYDWSIYKIFFFSLLGTFRCEEWAYLTAVETFWHLVGKYIGSFQTGIINL